MKIRLLMFIFAVPLLLVGCNRANVDVERNPDGGFNITATLNEAEVNTAIENALAQSANPLLRDPQVDLQTGQIIINGQHDRRDGGGTVSGSVTMTLSVQNGALAAQITQADVEGLDLTDERIADFNTRLAEGLARLAENDRGLITVQSITVTADNLQIVFTAQRQ